ncbi:hypothetical protein [Streptomyces sp. PanSC9]|uniref:hypothetical protein n=1 Tax=Streptomyces sp. PanSC9 TaxID=1520461 RepID=UPI000F46BFF3|nr:hypothetical protein [Streptomyces sp. PanSC9]ROP56075.1 hypothetical protein EDD94_5672 [Streptomyces sp. PanSC9]
MLFEAMTALAAASGSAVVQAAGTDAWNGFRKRVAALFGRGDAQREAAELERLDHTAQVLTAGGAEAVAQRARQEGAWQARFETLLEGLGEAEREEMAAELRSLLESVAKATGDSVSGTGKATAREGGTAVSGIKRTGGAPDAPAQASRTGDAEATGAGSSAVSGIVHDS